MSDSYEALRRGAAWMDLSARGRIVARGRDRARLLHNITSNEVKKLTPGAGCYAFLLTPQGRVQADLYLFYFADHFLIDTAADLREKVLQHIRRYIIADQVELEDVTTNTAALGIEGPGAAAILSSMGAPIPGADSAHVQWNDVTVAAVTLTGQPGFRIYSDAARLPHLIHQVEAAGAKPATPEDATLVRIENGKPLYGVDIRETSLPQETQQMHAVSFNKGCYIGQEIVERIRAQGHVNKKLVKLQIEAAEPLPAGTKLTADAKDSGEITSAVYSPSLGKVVALAYLRTPQATPGAVLKTESGAEATVLE
jgi:folate-binding protein YgfZ